MRPRTILSIANAAALRQKPAAAAAAMSDAVFSLGVSSVIVRFEFDYVE
jgi:hypothetical protein